MPDGTPPNRTWLAAYAPPMANGLEPYAYLRHVFEMLPQATTPADMVALLPWNVQRAALKPTR